VWIRLDVVEDETNVTVGETSDVPREDSRALTTASGLKRSEQVRSFASS